MHDRGRILVVDDDLELAESLREILLEEGYAVDLEPDGLAALERLRRWPEPDAILIDLSMPGLGGLGLLDRMGRTPALRAIPAGIITALPTARLPADRVLYKPFGADDLIAFVERLLAPIASGVRPIAVPMLARDGTGARSA